MTSNAATNSLPKLKTHSTCATRLTAHNGVDTAIEQLLQAVADSTRELTRPRPPLEENDLDYAQALGDFADIRGGKLFYPYLGSGIGRGPLVELEDGSVKYDMITGIGVHYYGHNHPELMRSAIRSAMSNTIMAGNLQQNVDSAALCEAILQLAKSDRHKPASASSNPLQHCFLTSSGAMANENAIKLAFHHRASANRLLAFEGCFCGRTIMLSQITDRPNYRVGLPNSFHIDYLPAYDYEKPDSSLKTTIDTLNRYTARYPNQHAAIKLELISGEGGFYPGSESFFRPLLEACRSQGIAVIADEVQTFGRTTRPFAFQHFNLHDLVDIVTIGKLSQVCATLFTATYRPKPGLLSQTFTGSASAIGAAKWIIDDFERGELFGDHGRITQVHQRFIDHFEAIRQRHPRWLSGPFGLGGMIACTPFGGDPTLVRTLLDQLFDLGVMAFMAGSNPTRLRMLPPVPVVTDNDIDSVCELLEQAMADVAQSTS